MKAYELLQARLLARPRAWLITGVAGFIGSNLLETLLRLNQRVVGLDNYSSGTHRNLEQVQERVGPDCWSHFLRLDGDIRDPATCCHASTGVDYILHHAALNCPVHSLVHRDEAHAHNVTGFLNILMAARDNHVQRVIYALCASVCSDEAGLPGVEVQKHHRFSPSALNQRTIESYADALSRGYGLETVGLRYFHVFGPRQYPDAPHATVIPQWIDALIQNKPIHLNGDGDIRRDFCYVANVVQANLLAATAENPEAVNQVYNVAARDAHSPNRIFRLLRRHLLPSHPHLRRYRPVHLNPGSNNGSHPPVDIAKAQRLLDYQPTHTIEQGLADTADWGEKHLVRPGKRRRQSSRPKEQMPAVHKPHPVTFAFLPNGAEEVSNPWLASEQPLVPGHASLSTTQPLVPTNAI